MLNLTRNELDEEYKRCRARDQQREEKIQFFTEQLATNSSMTPAIFLEAMGNKEILPGTCELIFF